jgi:osmotically-inducible protein OsmY
MSITEEAVSSSVPDEQVQARILEVWKRCQDLDDATLSVSVHRGHAIIEGTTDRFWKASCAEYLAARQPGAQSVENRVAITHSDSATDCEIAEAVAAAIAREARDGAGALHVKVDHGVVTLTGIVPSSAVRAHVEEEVHEIVGSTPVVNHVDVIAPPS